MRCIVILLLSLISYLGVANPVKRIEVKKVYDSQLHVRELTGKNDGVDVEKYLRYTGLGKGYAWCAAFVCWTLGEANVSNPKNAWSPSLVPISKLVYENKSKVYNGTPQRGDVFGIYYANLKRVGHVGFIDSWSDGDYAITVEGNTNGAGSREGDGVYKKRRLKTQIYRVANWIG